MIDPTITYTILLCVQAAHLLHHRIVRRHISFAEGGAAILLCIPPTGPLPAWLMAGAHLTYVAIQIVGSIWIKRLSPSWEEERQGRTSA